MAKITQRTKNQITDAAVNTVFDANQLYREEAKQLTQDFFTNFGIYVGFYNKVNKTSLTVEDALWTDGMVEQFQALFNTVRTNNKPVDPVSQAKKVNRRKKSTKALSWEEFQRDNGTSVAHAIYKEMKKQGTDMSRYDIAQALNIRISTVCGQIFQMEQAGLVKAVGIKIDPNSNRKVETLRAI